MSSQRDKRRWVPGLIGLAAGLLVLASLLVAGESVLRLQVALSDFLYLAEGRPKLGRLPASDSIVPVL